MTRLSGPKLLEAILSDPNNQEFTQNYIAEQMEASDQFRRSAPRLLEALDRRGIAWDHGVFFASLLTGELGLDVLEVVLEVINEITDTSAQRFLIRHLGLIKYPYDASAIVELFDNKPDRLLRLEICLTLPQTKAYNIDEWARRVIANPIYGNEYGDGRVALCAFSNMLKNKDGLADLLMSVFEDMPIFVPEPLASLAEQRHLEFMRDRLAHIADYPTGIRDNLRRNLEKAIGKAEKRFIRKAASAEKLAQNEAEKQRLRVEKQLIKEEQARAKRSK
jgi:hypothetical protein